jgi:uridylate kinase
MDKPPGPSHRSMANRTGVRSPPVVVSIGGSVFVTGDGDRQYLEQLAELLGRTGHAVPLVATTGGGRTAREYIRLGRDLGLTEVELDEIGIDVTRLHARLLAGRIGPPTPTHPPTSVREAVDALRQASPIVLGGTEPGHTTDGVAALIAARLRAVRVVNATSVDGIYDRDPRTHPDAHRLDRLSWPEFQRMVQAGASGEAGQTFLFDRLGTDTLARAGIPLAVVAGRNLSNLEAALTGRPFDGSLVAP